MKIYINFWILFLRAIMGSEMSSSILPRERFPHVIAHRGASGYLPEHSVQAYNTAIELETDYIEPDLCITKDGIFVAMHDLLLDDTTDVINHPEFVNKKSTKIVDGKEMTGYFVSDFTFDELMTLRLLQRLNGRSTLFNGLFQIPSFTDVMDLVQTLYAQNNHTIGIYVELKHPSFHNSLGFSMEDMLLQELTKGGYAIVGSSAYNNISQVVPVVIQCFEKESLQYLKTKTTLPLVQLIEADEGTHKLSDIVLKDIATYANGVGPDKKFLSAVPQEQAKRFIDEAHSLSLAVHPWTFRADRDIGARFNYNFEAEEAYYYGCLGVDGVFTEFPDRSRESVNNQLNGVDVIDCKNYA